MKHQFEIGGIRHDVWLARDGDSYRLQIGPDDFKLRSHQGSDGRVRLDIDGKSVEAFVAVDGDDVYIHLDGHTHHARFLEPVARHGRHRSAAAEDTAMAPMPGVVVALNVAPGQKIARGETLLVIESMKLETAIKAGRDGIVAAVHFEKGCTFNRGAALVSLQPEGAT